MRTAASRVAIRVSERVCGLRHDCALEVGHAGPCRDLEDIWLVLRILDLGLAEVRRRLDDGRLAAE